ncbi:hypothetical protein HPB52_006506 [Rhipicephalus sanguineus]|uniref:Uncharacterized protein n=1 Tax=Rhipicephalus sanguineus TaxID=34632 RepID=A0A9D4PXE2_RHISA|nr:hypothetical protein HPB52_006506 [Rhipicephalus sanguineus]
MEVEVEGEKITQEELTAERGWHTARSRRRDGRGGKNSSPSASPQTQESCSRTTPKKNVKAQVLKAGRMPPLPKNEIKIILRPKGGLHISKVGSPTVTAAIFHATKMPLEESQEDTICPNVQQNIIVISTPHPHNADRYVRLKSIHVNGNTHEVNAYEAAPDNTTKGVIRGIPLTATAQEIDANIVNTRNPLALAAKRIGTTTTVVIAFDGPSAPRAAPGHRMDVCPFSNNKICRGCGSRNPDQDHQCTPKCTLCDGAHPTADKECAAKYKTPRTSNLRKGELRRGIARRPARGSNYTPSYTPKPNTDDAAIDQLKKENAGMRELIQKLTQEVEKLKQLKTQPIPQVSESLSVTSPEAALSPAPQKRALQEGATGQVRSEVKDLLVSLQSTVETLHNALLEVAQRVTAMENNLHTLFPPSAPAAITMDTTDVARGVPALPPAASSIPHHGPH